MTNVLVIGAAGRMGQAVIRCLHRGAIEGLALGGAVDAAACPVIGRDAGELAGVGPLGMAVSSDASEAGRRCDVWIDFSFHAATASHARHATDQGKALVIGTTGLTDDEQATVRSAAARIPIVMAPNMSLGVNLLVNLAETTARVLRDQGYDVEIIERHHRLKQDAPSGTAIGLGEAVARGLEWDLRHVSVHGREGMSGQRPSEQIGFHAVRGGDIVGDHTVVFAGEGEVVELTHRATSRDTFALGALRAAAWIAGRKPGLYSMKDVLGLA